MNVKTVWLFLLVIAMMACTKPQPINDAPHLYETQIFKEYWFAGKAEINSYSLTQSRYGESHEGKAVLIFVTEDFSKTKQVKLDNPPAKETDKVPVLKMNFTKNFVTGIYPYSMMLSVFTPVSLNQTPHTIKLSMSSQEWCGQVYSQVNLSSNKYSIRGHSYFELEDEQHLTLKITLLEDELWNRIRLDPENLPEGKIELIPGLFYSRLNHVEQDIETAICTKEERGEIIFYQITYPEKNRSFTIEFQKAFPHTINKWVETFQQGGNTFTTSATLDKQLVTDYWTKNKNEFQYLRDSLNLSRKN